MTVADEVVASLSNLTASSPDWEPLLRAYAGMFDPVFSLVADQGYPEDPGYVPGWSVLLNPDTCPTQFLPYLAQFNGTTVPAGTDDQTARLIIKLESGMQRGTTAAIQAAALRFLSGTPSISGTLQSFGTTNLPMSISGPTTSIPVNPLSQTVAPQTITITDPTLAHSQNFQVMTAAQPNATSLNVYPQTPNYAYPAASTIQGPFLFIHERFNGLLSAADPYHLTIGYRLVECSDTVGMLAAINAVKPAGIIIDLVGSNGWTWNQSVGTWNADSSISWVQSYSQQP